MAARGCGGRGPYANSIGGRESLEVCGSSAAEHNPLRGVPRNWLQRNRTEKTMVEEAARKDLFAGGAEKNVARGSARRVRVEEGAFMRQS